MKVEERGGVTIQEGPKSSVGIRSTIVSGEAGRVMVSTVYLGKRDNNETWVIALPGNVGIVQEPSGDLRFDRDFVIDGPVGEEPLAKFNVSGVSKKKAFQAHNRAVKAAADLFKKQ